MRVLHMIPDIGISNGVMSVILNYFKAMPEDIKFDVVYFSETKKTRQADIEALGGRVFKIDAPSPKDLITGKMNFFFEKHPDEWQALHIHCPHFAVFIAPYAKKHGIHKIAMHCHSTWYSLDPKNNFRNKMLYLMGSRMVDTKFACGKAAGHFWYGSDKNFTVLPNAIDCDKFRYNEEIRNKKREELGLKDSFIVGHLGRVSPPQKNHTFLLKVFSQIKKKKENAVLLMAGAEKNEELDALSKQLGIEKDIFFLGARTDVCALCQAYDLFLFPSFWEGLPVSVVEAQAAGLPVVMSDSVTDEVCVTDHIISLPLSESPEIWAQKALDFSEQKNRYTFDIMKKSGWDIYECAERLVKYYKNH